MIRDLAKALIAVLAFLILVAEVQRSDDTATDQFEMQRAAVAHL
jgi:hypothetical protein